MDDVRVNDALDGPRDRMVAAVDGLLAALNSDTEVACTARAAEDHMEALHDALEQRYGLGLISDWTDPDDEPFDGPVVRVRLALEVLNEERRDEVMPLVDERLCDDLDERKFAILSTTRVFPGARGSAADVRGDEKAAAPMPSPIEAGALQVSQLSPKLAKRRERLLAAVEDLLAALEEYGDQPRKRTRRRVHQRQDRFEARLYSLHAKVLRRTGSPLVTVWGHAWDDLPWTGPVALRTVFDVADSETEQALLSALAQSLDGLAPNDFRLSSATVSTR